MTALHAGDNLDHYRIEVLVARSGMASIYRATDLRSDTPVALNIPHPEVECDPVFFDRFRREEEIGTKLDHPCVMKVFPNPGASQIYMVMEWVEGDLLRMILRNEGKQSSERSVQIVLKLCDALDYIHSHGVIHRDLKPENIIVGERDKIKLIDFGIAGLEGARRLTFGKLSQVMGTPDYISPEQVRGKRGDARSDIYAVGVMLYEMLTGTVPFRGPNAFAIMNSRLLNNPVPPREIESSITPELQEILYRALERDPKNRYKSAQEFAWDLQHQDQIGVADREELKNWKRQRSSWLRDTLFYLMLAAIPVLVFGLLFFIARRK